MCLAVPGKIISIISESPLKMAEVDFYGTRRQICIQTVDANVGDYIIAHAGVAISTLDAKSAEDTINDLILIANHEQRE